MDKQLLKQIGFLDAEIEIYTALLRLGPCMVSGLNQEIGLNRTYIYDILEKLREKGLVSTFIESGKKHFQAASPTNILLFIEEKKEALKEFVLELEKLMNQPREETQIEIFKGKNGIKTVLQDVIKTGMDYCVMGNIKKFEEIIEFSFPHFLDKIEKARIRERIICDKRETILKIRTGTYRYLNSEYLFPSSFWIYGEKVIIFIWSLPYFAAIINNKEVSRTYQSYFEFFWNLAEK